MNEACERQGHGVSSPYPPYPSHPVRSPYVRPSLRGEPDGYGGGKVLSEGKERVKEPSESDE